MFKSAEGNRTLIVSLVLVLVNDPYFVAQLINLAPEWLKPLLNLVLVGAGLKFLNDKLNKIKAPAA